MTFMSFVITKLCNLKVFVLVSQILAKILYIPWAQERSDRSCAPTWPLISIGPEKKFLRR